MVFQNYRNFTEETSNKIDIVAFGVGLKCLRKIHSNTQWGEGVRKPKNMITYVIPNLY